jgi:hypothetical protein
MGNVNGRYRKSTRGFAGFLLSPEENPCLLRQREGAISMSHLSKTLVLSTVAFCVISLPAQQSQFDKQLSGDREILHVLDRLTFGPRPGDIEAVKKMGLRDWIDLQLHPERIKENEILATLVKPLVEPSAPVQVERVTKMRAQAEAQGGGELPNVPQPGQMLAQAKLLRAIRSDRQLEEVLVDFWYNHFNVDAGKGADWYLVTAYERDAIRPHVLGRFRDLLGAAATSPAMMFYLDNWQSAAATPGEPARGLNENYARELMELHTLGVDGGYTQQDIIEVARCFTGWTIENPTTGGAFRYDDQMHDKGGKTVLGVTIPAGGSQEDGEKVLDNLAHHPSTARLISRELAQRFVADDPPPALIDRMAKTFRDSDGDIRAVLTTLFNSKEFSSEGAYRAKFKTPFEVVVSAARASDARVDNAGSLVTHVSALGQPLYRKLEPTGYSNVAVDWTSSTGLMARMNFALDVAQNRIPGVWVDSAKFSVVPAIAARQLLFIDVASKTLEAIGKALSGDVGREGRLPGQGPSGALVAGMLLGSPDFQLR